MENTKSFVKLLSTGEIVEVYFHHRDGISYVTDNGIKIVQSGEYEELNEI